MKNSRLIIFASLVLAGILLVQFNQMPNLDKQLGQARADLKQAKVNQVKSQTIVSSPKSRQETVSNSTRRVNKFVQTFSNQPTSSYPDGLKGLASQKVINELTQTFAPSVTFSDKAHYDVPFVGLKNAWGSDLEYLVIAKSDTQSVAYTITYDTDDKQVTDMSRLTLKGAFDNENKVLLSIMGLLLVGLGITMSITNHKRSQIADVRKEVSQVAKTQKHVTTQIDNLQTTYNANDAKAKSKLLKFAKAYYTFSSQSDYEKRFNQVSDILSLSDDQKNQLFDSGLDATGGSRIDNLGLTSQYQTATGYTSDLDNQTIEILATVVVKTSGTAQKAISQTVLLHGWFDIKAQKLTSIKINQIQIHKKS